jgi:hypothetical protein
MVPIPLRRRGFGGSIHPSIKGGALMKRIVQGLLAVLFVWAVSLSWVRLDPIDAQCAAQNDLVAFDGGATTDPTNGEFDYTLTIDSWDLTFTPFGLILDVHPSGGSINVLNVVFTPDMELVTGCINDDDVVIEVSGELDVNTKDGNVNARIRLTNGGSTYSEPWATFIPRVP